MAEAEVTRPFKGCEDGELRPRSFIAGETIHGRLAAAMVAAGYAKKKALTGAPRDRMTGPDRNRDGFASGPASRSRKRK